MLNMNHRLACFSKTWKIFMAYFELSRFSDLLKHDQENWTQYSKITPTQDCISASMLLLSFAHSQRLEKVFFCSNVQRAYTDYDV